MGRGSTLMTPILQSLVEMKIKLLLLAEVAIVVVLRQSFSRVPVNFTNQYHFAILF